MVLFPLEYLRERILDEIRRYTEKAENVFWVTELIYCPLRRKYMEQLTVTVDGKKIPPVIAEQLDTPSLVLGDLIHRGLEQWLGEKGCEVEKEVEREIEVEDKKYIIRGRVDAICGDTVIEIKYARDLKSDKPLQHHVQQVQIYMWMTGLREGKIIYVTPSRLLCFDVKAPYQEPQVALLVQETLRGEPAPRHEWECQYCPFQAICPRSRQQMQRR